PGRLDDVEAGAAGRSAVGVHRDDRVGLDDVAEPAAHVDARPDPTVAGPGQPHVEAAGGQQRPEPEGDVPGEGVLRVPGRGLRADLVARLAFAVPGVDQPFHLAEVVDVAAVVAGVDHHDRPPGRR